MDDEDDGDGSPRRKKNGQARKTLASQELRIAMHQPVAWAVLWGNERNNLAEDRILETGHWPRYLKMMDREKRANSSWARSDSNTTAAK